MWCEVVGLAGGVGVGRVLDCVPVALGLGRGLGWVVTGGPGVAEQGPVNDRGRARQLPASAQAVAGGLIRGGASAGGACRRGGQLRAGARFGRAFFGWAGFGSGRCSTVVASMASRIDPTTDCRSILTVCSPIEGS